MAKAITRDRHIQWKPASKGVAHVRQQQYRRTEENVLCSTLFLKHDRSTSTRILRMQMKS